MEKFWSKNSNDVLNSLQTTQSGLTQFEAENRLQKYGENVIDQKSREKAYLIFLNQFKSPIMLILMFATIISFFSGDYTDSIIILIIIFLSAIISFLQEYRANTALLDLLKVISVSSIVLRDNNVQEISVKDLVIGDIVLLSAGDIIPADLLILESNNLSVDESTLTGETFPVEKSIEPVNETSSLEDRHNCLWMGTHVISGTGKAVLVNTAKDSEFGEISKSLLSQQKPTGFEIGVKDFGILIVKITFVMIAFIFLFNIMLKKPMLESFLFALALAVGLTPQMLPAIISVNLSSGSKRMANKSVIVKKLPSIENFGSMNILCSDKTGTITIGEVELVDAMDISNQSSPITLQLATLNASLQSGYSNPIDDAIKSKHSLDLSGYTKLDEIPYSFETKALSVILSTPNDSFFKGQDIVVTKGALENVLDNCRFVLNHQNEKEELSNYNETIKQLFETYSSQGYRVLGVSYNEGKTVNEMIFVGLLLFLDPIKEGLKETINTINDLGVKLKIITGDNRLIAKHIASELDLMQRQY